MKLANVDSSYLFRLLYPELIGVDQRSGSVFETVGCEIGAGGETEIFFTTAFGDDDEMWSLGGDNEVKLIDTGRNIP